MRSAEEYEGFDVGGQNINNVRYSGDAMLKATLRKNSIRADNGERRSEGKRSANKR